MTLLILFSHKLTQEQIIDAKSNLNINTFIYLPDDLKEIWSQIPTSLKNLDEYLLPVLEFINKYMYNSAYVLIQGDFGATYLTVNHAKNNGLIPIYSTTQRVSYEKKVEGKVIKTSHFKHIMFRRY